jgi:exodeoxyribonuclease V beta subunit
MTHASSPSFQPLLADCFPLWGSRLIEASAGTGKTWTIAALYVRLVLGHGDADSGFGRPLAPSDILVMTFTRAATRELSERIRERLLEAARCFRGDARPKDSDTFLAQLMQDYPAGTERQQAAWRLATAAEGMDDASIHTIDAWCQRMLREHAFDSGHLFDETLVASEQALVQEAVQDYWRSECYPLSPELLAQVLGVWKDIDTLRQDVTQLLPLRIEAPAPLPSLQGLIADWSERLPTQAERIACVAQMQDWLMTELEARRTDWHASKLKTDNARRWLAQLTAWAQEATPLALPDLGSGLTRLRPDGLREARTRSGGTTIALPPAFEWFAGVVDQYQQDPLAIRMRRHACAQVAQRLERLKRQGCCFGFADMLDRLGLALRGPNGDRLRARIMAQYPVALIDEFQDTSPLQYELFDRIYRTQENARDRALLLIGDPKQSIYGFRGADIYSYLRARQATEGRHYVLDTNYRSTQPLVEAINHCFLQAEQGSEGAFRFASGGHDPLPYVRVKANGRAERLIGADGPLPALTLVHDLALQNAATARSRFAQRCAEQIARWLNDAQMGFAEPDERFTRLRPSDIAVLVRTGKEAGAVRLALQQRGIASVYLSDKESVFQSDEARDLVHWLRGVSMPQEATLVRAALATRSIGLSLPELGQLATDDDALDRHSAILQDLQQVWQQQGVLALLRQTLHRFGLAARWLDQDLGGERRLTNFLHLAELLQNASRLLDGEQALIRWLQQRIDEEAGDGDDTLIRLESDADLVKVITIHKSKGLEFPVVCLPFATHFREASARTAKVLSLPNAQGQRRVVLAPNADDIALAERERLREDLRLLYVALTRPRHALWVGFAAIKVGKAAQCQSHKSAIGCLLAGGQALAPTDWLAQLTLQTQGCPQMTLLAAAHSPTACTPLRPWRQPTPLVEAPRFDTPIERDWRIASYSRLTSSLKGNGTSGAFWRPPRPADNERLPSAAPPDASANAATPSAGLPIPHAFRRGPQAGDFLHEQLEWLAGHGFALARELWLQTQLLQRLARSAHSERATETLAWLTEVVTTPLPGPDVALDRLHTVQAEMEFWLPLERIRLETLDQACRRHLLPGLERPALPASEVQGMLMGFADLVFEHQGRYWVLDYKSNHLGPHDADYRPEALAQAMAQHRYDVQAGLYLIALHRLLASRLGADYEPQQHLGGAVFLFLRGIRHPGRGACVLQPEADFYQTLETLPGLQEPCA